MFGEINIYLIPQKKVLSKTKVGDSLCAWARQREMFPNIAVSSLCHSRFIIQLQREDATLCLPSLAIL